MDIEYSYDTPIQIIAEVCAMAQSDLTQEEIAQKITDSGYPISRRTIGNIFQKFENFQLGSKRENCGRKPIFDCESRDRTVQAVLEDRFLTAADIALDSDLNSSGAYRQTIHNILENEGLHAFFPRKMLKIDEKAAKNRLKWCLKHTNYTVNQWKKIVFSDECKVHSEQFRIRFVRRYTGEELGEEYYVQKTKYEGQSGIYVWGANSTDGPVGLICFEKVLDARDYLKTIKKQLPKVDGLNTGDLRYQHDNWAVHNATIVCEWFNDQNFETIEWLSLILTLQKMFGGCQKYRIWEQAHEIQSKQQLTRLINNIFWNDSMIKIAIRRCFESMPYCIQKVIEREGQSCRY